MSGKLTTDRKTILHYLARRKDHDCPPSGPEISEYFRRPREWAQPQLKAMERMGFVEKLGVSASNARCWSITPAGRTALEKNNG